MNARNASIYRFTKCGTPPACYIQRRWLGAELS